MPTAQCLQHHLLRYLVGTGLDHQQRFRRARHAKVEQAMLHLRDGRIDNDLPVDVPDPHRSHWPAKRHVRYSERSGGSDDRQDIRLVLCILG